MGSDPDRPPCLRANRAIAGAAAKIPYGRVSGKFIAAGSGERAQTRRAVAALLHHRALHRMQRHALRRRLRRQHLDHRQRSHRQQTTVGQNRTPSTRVISIHPHSRLRSFPHSSFPAPSPGKEGKTGPPVESIGRERGSRLSRLLALKPGEGRLRAGCAAGTVSASPQSSNPSANTRSGSGLICA